MSDNTPKVKKRKLSKGQVATIVIAAILGVVLVISIAISAVFANITKLNMNSEATMAQSCARIYRFLPKELDGSVTFSDSDVREVTYHLVPNENFDENNGDLIQYFKYVTVIQ